MSEQLPPAGRFVPAPIRSAEIQEIAQAIRAGRSVLIAGVAGIGKTATLAAALTEAAASGRRIAALTATSAMAVIPLGALMSLIEDDADVVTPVERALAAHHGAIDRQLDVLAIDDAHLLDSASAGVVHQLAASGVTIVLAVRSGSRVHDALILLVKDGGALRCELQPLTIDEASQFAQRQLDGEVDAGLVRAVHGRSRGNPLAIGALIRESVARHSVVYSEGIWRLRGFLPMVDELVELMRMPVDRLSSSALDAVELVALADGLPLHVLLHLAEDQAVDEAELAGVLDVSGPGEVRVGHPLIGDAVLAMLPTVRRRTQLARLIAALERSGDLVHEVAVARWSIELGREIPPARLRELAELVLASDPGTSEFFLRAAIDRGAGPDGAVRLAEVLAHQYRPEDCLSVLDSIDLDTLSPKQVLAVQMTRAYLLIMPTQRSDDGLALLDDLREQFGSFPMLEALSSTGLWRSGRPKEAGDIASEVVDHSASPPDAVAHALLTSATLRIYDGDEAGFAEHLPRLEHFTARERASLPEGEDATLLLAAIAPLYTTLDLARVRQLCAAGYAHELAAGDDGTRAQYAMILGRAALIAGDTDHGVRFLSEAVGARGVWCTSSLPLTRSYLVQALVIAGRQEDAETLGELLAAEPRSRYLDPEAEVALASLLAGRGDLRGAGERAVAAARSVPDGEKGIAVVAWYEGVRYTHPDAPSGFLRLVADIPGPARDAQRSHARAVLARDPRVLESAAGELLAAGLGGYALDAMAGAVRLLKARHSTDATRALERLRFLQVQFPNYNSPLVRGLDRPALTARESEIARLASLGNSDREIAAFLSITVRTVETHLFRVYGKLGVRGRAELAPVLTGSRQA